MPNDNVIVLKVGADKSKLFNVFAPAVLFVIPSDLTGYEYFRWLTELFQEFICGLSKHPSNQHRAQGFFLSEVGEEGGVGGLFFDDEGEDYFRGCKLYAYDPSHPHTHADWKGLRMINHMDMRSQVEPIYRLAERFELFLRQKGIAHQRFGSRVDGNGELCEQVTE